MSMSEQDKRPLYMGTYERHKKELQVKHDDVILQLKGLHKSLKYSIVLGGIALGISLVALAM
jgi:hypothetical protein